MSRSLMMVVPVLAIGLAMPAAAQQISDQNAHQIAEKYAEAWVTAFEKKDAAGLAAALYTEDAMRVTPDGLVYGRAAIENDLVEMFRVMTDVAIKVDQVKVSNGVILESGSWAAKFNGPTGPVPVKGFWGTTEVPDGGTWKARLDTFNMSQPPHPMEVKK
jgi:ketosteroid isomerase-like protein